MTLKLKIEKKIKQADFYGPKLYRGELDGDENDNKIFNTCKGFHPAVDKKDVAATNQAYLDFLNGNSVKEKHVIGFLESFRRHSGLGAKSEFREKKRK